MRDDFLEFGGQPFKFPESCSDRYGPYLNPIPSHGSTPLGGNAFEDLPKLIERIDSVTGYRMPAERKLLRGLLQRVIDHLTGHLPLALDTGTVSVEQHAMLRVTNKALEDEVFALREELHRLHDEFTDERSLLNKCMEGAMPARTAHAISVKAANDLHAYLTCLINTHPYYDEAFTPGTGNPGRLPLDALTCAFPTRRSLALATSQQILAINGVGQVTLTKVVETFKADNMPAFCAIDVPDFDNQYGHWRRVNGINRREEYRWTLPDFLLGEGAHVVRKFNGASYLAVAFNQADNPLQAPVGNSANNRIRKQASPPTSEPSRGIDRPQHGNLADKLEDDDIPWAWPPTSTAEAPEPSSSRSAIGCSALQSDP